MDWTADIVLVGAGLVVISILSSTFAFRFGTPLLVIFLGIGLIAGEDGLGLVFNNAELAYFIGSLALAIILFDSGFGTRTQTLKRAAAPAFVMATVGVFLTTILVGIAARFLFDISWLHAFLMGAIVSSTDAAAVFFLLRTGGVKIYKRVRSMLEVESGSNDPMAIFLTILLIEMILTDSPINPFISFLYGFGMQMGLGMVVGFIGGYLIVEIVNRIKLEEALYSILVISTALCVFAITDHLGGSGFLAIYVAGIVAGNRAMRATATLRKHQQGMTWLAQIIMFLVLGLFVTPSEFGSVLIPSILLGLFLIVIGRPLAVLFCLLPFRLGTRIIAFNSWVGLRGAVSILLGILPAVMGVDNADMFINVAFIMVITSLIVQGWTIKPAAKWLKLIIPNENGPIERVEIELPGNPKHELLIYRVLAESPVLSGQSALPSWATPSLIVRNGVSIQPNQAGQLQAEDLVYLFAQPENAPFLDRFFCQLKALELSEQECLGQFTVNPDARLTDLIGVYDQNAKLTTDTPKDITVGEYMVKRLKGSPVVADRVSIGRIDLVVRRVLKGRTITEVGLSLTPNNWPKTYKKRS